MKSEVLKDEIISLLESKKAEDIVAIDLRKKVDFADFFVICSTHSTRHAQGLADFVMLELEKLGIKPIGVEGLELGQWIVLDYNTVVVHIFYQPVRELYALEELWMDEPPTRKGTDSPPPS